jgi:hypothetical protein
MGIDVCHKVNGTEYGLQSAPRSIREQYSQEGVGFWAAFKNRRIQHIFKVPPVLGLTFTISKIPFKSLIPSAFLWEAVKR